MRSLENNFDQIISTLNAQQRTAVETIEGPVLVIAGPGTGKTHILSARVGQILKQTDAAPYNILCLTFTDAGVRAMRERLQSWMGAEANAVHIFTFHGFCNKVIQENISIFGKNELSLIDDLERRQLIRTLLNDERRTMNDENTDRSSFIALRSSLKNSDPYFYEKQLNHLFALMKKEAWTSDFVVQKVDEYLASLTSSDAFIYKKTKKGQFAKGDIKVKELEEERERMLKLRAAAPLYDVFEKLMRDNQFYDFDDMVTWVIEAFGKHNFLLRNYQEQYLYILVDEFQDTNGAQNKILAELINFWDSPNIFIVGDDDQAIYEFQGARLHNLVEFYEKYHNDLKVVVLKDNYRSTQKILDASKLLIDHNEIRIVHRLNTKTFGIAGETQSIASLQFLDKTLTAHQPPVKHSVQITEYPNRLYELHEIVSQLSAISYQLSAKRQKKNENSSLISHLSSLSDIAVIYSRHSEAETLIRLFEQRGIPYQTKRRLNILETPLIQNLRLLLTYLAAETEKPFSADALLFKILSFRFWEVPVSDVMHLAMNIARQTLDVGLWTLEEKEIQNPTSNVQRPIYWRNELRNVEVQNFEPLKRFTQNLDSWIVDAITLSPITVLEKIMQQGNVLNWVNAQPERVMYLQLLNSLFEFVRTETYKNPRLTLPQLVITLDLLDKNAMPIEMIQNIVRPDGVVLTTAHAAKGLEFEYVFLMNAVETSWEKNKSGNANQFKLPNNLTYSTEFDAVEARRRLFYVAATRAKKHLQVSYSLQDEKGKTTARSMFVDEILNDESKTMNDEKKEHSESSSVIVHRSSLNVEDTLSSLLQLPLKPSPPILDAAFINDILIDFRLSASSLQTYLTCPLQFFYDYILKIPSLPSANALYGSAVHEALQKLFSTMHKDIGRWTLEVGQATTTESNSVQRLTSKTQNPLKNIFLNFFERAMQHQRGFFPEKNYFLFLERGIANLDQYFEKNLLSFEKNVKLEANINTEFKNIPLHGKIDKIIFKENNVAQVADYKTGTFKTSDVSVPTEKNRLGGKYFRQLVFYKILYENYRSKIVIIERGIVDYVEPKSNGTFDKKEIVFTEAHVQSVQNDIETVWQKIQNHEFTGCGKRDCAWCRFFTQNQSVPALVDEDVESLDD